MLCAPHAVVQKRLAHDETQYGPGASACCARPRRGRPDCAREAGMVARADAEHLAFASVQRRVLFSYNASDYYRLHTEWRMIGRAHAGIILVPQQRYSIGELTRRLLHLVSTLTPEQMRNRVEFLSSW